MKREWRFLVIDVDYHPCDPGSTQWFCERTRYREEIEAYQPLNDSLYDNNN